MNTKHLKAQRFFAAWLLIALTVPTAFATGTFEIVARTGDSAAGDGIFDGSNQIFSPPTLNSNGVVAFSAQLDLTSNGNANDSAIFRGNGSSLTEIVREGDPAPNNDGSFSLITGATPIRLNDANQVAFSRPLNSTSSFSNAFGIFRGSGGPLTRMVRRNDIPPDNNGNFDSLNLGGLNNNGEVSFSDLSINNTTGGFLVDDQGLYRANGTTITEIARTGQGEPSLVDPFIELRNVTLINDSGQVAFDGRRAVSVGPFGNNVVFRGDGTSHTQIARSGQLAPDGNGRYTFLNRFGINESGDVLFHGDLANTTGGIIDNEGIFVGDGSGPVKTIVREGDPAPDNNGTMLAESTSNTILNDAGQVGFIGFPINTTNYPLDGKGVFRGDGTVLEQISRGGDLAPNGSGVFDFYNNVDLNHQGQMAFIGELTNTNSGTLDDRGLYFYDDDCGLIEVIREGDAFDGGIVTEVNYRGGAFMPDVRSGLNEVNQVAFQYRLNNGLQGVAIWAKIPEPATGVLFGLAIGVLAITGNRRRHASLREIGEVK